VDVDCAIRSTSCSRLSIRGFASSLLNYWNIVQRSVLQVVPDCARLAVLLRNYVDVMRPTSHTIAKSRRFSRDATPSSHDAAQAWTDSACAMSRLWAPDVSAASAAGLSSRLSGTESDNRVTSYLVLH